MARASPEPGQGEHVAVLLAAGGSRRLGQPKQLLTRNGETLVHRAARLALETHPRKLIVAVGAQAAQVRDAVRDLACECTQVDAWSDGLAASLGAVAGFLEDDTARVMVLGCDQPALEAAHLLKVLHGAMQSPDGWSATSHGDTPGIPAVVPRSWFGPDVVPEGNRGFAACMRAELQVGASPFLLDAPELRFDIDTLHDLAEARARGWMDGGR